MSSKIYVGQKNSNNAVSNKKVFSLGSIYNPSESLLNEFNAFIEAYNISDYKELLKEERSEELNYFINNILNNKNFFVCVYDKNFILSKSLVTSLFSEESKNDLQIFYSLVSALSKENDEMFQKYTYLLENKSKENYSKFLEYLYSKEYENEIVTDVISHGARFILEEDNYERDILMYPEPNLVLKEVLNKSISKIAMKHDLNANDLEIADSENILPQFVASFIEELMIKIMDAIKTDKIWNKENEYILEVYRLVLKQMGENSLKCIFSVPEMIKLQSVFMILDMKLQRDSNTFKYMNNLNKTLFAEDFKNDAYEQTKRK